MSKKAHAAIDEAIEQLFAAERAVRKMHDQLVHSDRNALLTALGDAVAAARKEKREDEASLRLVRLAAVLGELDGPKAVDLLIDVLASESGEARYAAGEALTELSFDRFKEVALGVERALERLAPDSPALGELPFVLAEVPEPGVTKLLVRMLALPNAEVVASAIEASAEVGDPALAKAIGKLVDDPRPVTMDDDEGESDEVTLGQLAREALELFGDDGD
jgi:HEAT repeat protein